MGDSMPKVAQFTGRKAVSGGVSNLLRGGANMSGGSGGAANIAESKTDGQKEQGDPVRRIR